MFKLNTRRDWAGKTPEEILEELKDFLTIHVESGAIRNVTGLKNIDSGLWAALKNHTEFGPAGCFEKVGYGY